MIGVVLRLSLLAAVATAATTYTKPDPVGTHGIRRGPAPVRPDRPSAATGPGVQRARGPARPSPYWRLERRLVAEQHRLGREIRRLRGVNSSLRHRHRRIMRRLQARASHGSSTVAYAIRLAASTFGLSEQAMRSVAACETGGTFDPGSKNPGSSASGLFQFLDSTWRSDGLAGFSVWDPIANALAAARLVAKDGGWGEWSCQP